MWANPDAIIDEAVRHLGAIDVVDEGLIDETVGWFTKRIADTRPGEVERRLAIVEECARGR